MPQRTPQLTFARTIAFALLVFLTNAFGQKTPIPKCVEDDYECLVSAYTTEINSNPKDYRNYYSRGLLYIYLKDYVSALRDYDKAISLNPKSDESYSGRGYIYQLQGRYAEAIAEFNKAIELNPNSTYAIEGGKSALEFLKSKGSIEDFSKLIESVSNNAEYYYLRGKKYFESKDFTKAIEDSSKAIELNPKYFEPFAVRSDSYCKLNKEKEANADIARYEVLTGKKTGAFCLVCGENIIDCYIKDLTIKIAFEMKKEVSKQLRSLYGERGILCYKKGDYDNALSDFNKSISNNYSFSEDRYYRGDIYLRKGKYNEALIDFQAALSRRTNYGEANLGIGEVYLHQGYQEAALNYFNQAISLNPRLGKAYFGRGTIYLKFGEDFEQSGRDEDRSKAVEAYRQAVKNFDAVIDIELNNAPSETYLRRSKAYEKLGESGKAANDRAKYQELGEKP